MIKSPARGDILIINLSPTEGHEQKGSRPVVVISNTAFNKKAGMCIVVPITSISKNYPFEVPVVSSKTSGVILSDQIRSIDYQARDAKKIDAVSENCFKEVLKKIHLILS